MRVTYRKCFGKKYNKYYVYPYCLFFHNGHKRDYEEKSVNKIFYDKNGR